jgi:MerR family transcriptional regulator, light-induced transcriptional regulator
VSTFSIKDIENLTGIRSHTIRIWEQRYDLVKPRRTDTNIRFYDDEDLRTFLNIAILYKAGYKISAIAQHSPEQLSGAVLETASKNTGSHLHLQAMISAMLSLDENAFDELLQASIRSKGVEATMLNLVFPFLFHIGLLWQSGSINPAFEHFITSLIRKRLILATDTLPAHRNGKSGRYLLFLPEGEPHELGLLFANYLLRKQGQHTLYLGANLPHRDLEPVIEKYRPDFIFSSLIAPASCGLQELVDYLSSFPGIRVLLTGNLVLQSGFRKPDNVSLISSLSDLASFLEENS